MERLKKRLTKRRLPVGAGDRLYKVNSLFRVETSGVTTYGARKFKTGHCTPD